MHVRHQNTRQDSTSAPSYHRLFDNEVARVEELETLVQTHGRGVAGYTKRRHIVLPYRGSFQWHVGSADIFAEPTQALFVNSGEEYRISHPLGGDASLVLWPDETVWDELTGPIRANGELDDPFRQRSRLLSHRAQLLANGLRQAAWHGTNGLGSDEMTLGLLKALACNDPPSHTDKPIPHAKINLARAFLHEHYREAVTLSQIARAVGLSSVYLTQSFTRAYGVSMYRYVTRMRMAEAVSRIADCEDLTDLALDLGFSSHSHFSSTFRSAFGCSPSTVRERFRGKPVLMHQEGGGKPAHGIVPTKLDLCLARSNFDEGIRWSSANRLD
jgi:AraC family transcriptional regulator